MAEKANQRFDIDLKWCLWDSGDDAWIDEGYAAELAYFKAMQTGRSVEVHLMARKEVRSGRIVIRKRAEGRYEAHGWIQEWWGDLDEIASGSLDLDTADHPSMQAVRELIPRNADGDAGVSQLVSLKEETWDELSLQIDMLEDAMIRDSHVQWELFEKTMDAWKQARETKENA